MNCTEPVLDGSSTPQWLFDLLNEQVKERTGQSFQLDAAASRWNAKCENYFDEETDALEQDWAVWPTIFCNAPFCKPLIEQFVQKAIEAADAGSTVVLLLPSWPGYPWFQELKQRGEMQDVIGPVSFENSDGSTVCLNNGHRTTGIAVVTLGPVSVGGTNGPPIRKPGSLAPPSIEAATANGRATARRRSRVVPLDSIEPQETEWLWHHRIPLGELTIVDGDPSVNKSSVLLDLAARVSTGAAMPDGTPGVEGGVLLMLAEDSLEKTIVQRLEVAGADRRRITALEGVTLPGNQDALTEATGQFQAKLVLIDPLMAFLACDANGDQKVRRALTPLKELAEKTNAAVVMVRHLTKRGGKHALYRGSGSIGIIAATRSALLVGRSPDEPNLRVLCHTKSNLGPLAPSLLFEPVDMDGTVQIEWRGECEYTADDILTTSSTADSRLGEAMLFLNEILADEAVLQRNVRLKAVENGIALRTLERAKELLGVVSTREHFGPGGHWVWKLPEQNTASS